MERRIGVAVDFSACSRKALKWAVDNVARAGDHLILITVRPEGNYEEGEVQLWEATGSRNSLSLSASFDALFSDLIFLLIRHLFWYISSAYI